MKMKMFGLFALMITLMAIGVLAGSPTVTLLTPAASGTVAGTSYTLNATIDFLSNNNTVYNVTFNASCTNTANTTSTTVLSLTNHNTSESGNGVQFANGTFNSRTALEDSSVCTFSANVRNDTQTESDTSTSVIVDNTVPNAPTSVSPASGADGSVQSSWSATVVGRNTTSCTLRITDPYGILTSYDMTHSSNSCTLTRDISVVNGMTWVVRASDGANTTDSSDTVTTSKNGGGASLAAAQQQAQQQVQQQQQQTTSKKNFAIVAIVVIVAYLFLAKKKR